MLGLIRCTVSSWRRFTGGERVANRSSTGSYNFQKAEAHALEHIVQWHGTILAKLALVPQRVLNSYTRDTGNSNEGKSCHASLLLIEHCLH